MVEKFLKWLKKIQGAESVILVADTLGKHGRCIPQNMLNKYNAGLLKCCDGILINFEWTLGKSRIFQKLVGTQSPKSRF